MISSFPRKGFAESLGALRHQRSQVASHNITSVFEQNDWKTPNCCLIFCTMMLPLDQTARIAILDTSKLPSALYMIDSVMRELLVMMDWISLGVVRLLRIVFIANCRVVHSFILNPARNSTKEDSPPLNGYNMPSGKWRCYEE
jgi:hypothetical protein